jgi:uncharacterized protein (DUF736 family)
VPSRPIGGPISTEIETMATIGTFAEKDRKLIGKIQTLSINALLTFLPNQNKPSPDVPAYAVFTGRTYYSVRLDDPTFAVPFIANLVAQNEGGFAPIWSRL